VGARRRAVEELYQMRRLAAFREHLKERLEETLDRLRRQNRFHTLFQLPNSLGNARQVILWTVK
jgi:hypothetical protein